MIAVKVTRHKAVAATVGALATVLTAIGAALADGEVTIGDEGAALAALAVGLTAQVYAVWRVPNRPVEVPAGYAASSGARR